jgi:hypothetical protein
MIGHGLTTTYEKKFALRQIEKQCFEITQGKGY